MSRLNYNLNTDEVNAQIGIFNDVFNEGLNECAPIETREVKRPYAPWINEDIRTKIKEREEVRKKLKKDRRNENLIREYKPKKNHASSLLKTAKTSYFENEILKISSKETWKAIKNVIPNKRKNVKLDFDNPNKKAGQFNCSFANVGGNTFKRTQEILGDEDKGNYQGIPFEVNNEIKWFRPQSVTIDTVILTFKTLKDRNAFGVDGIPTCLLIDSLYVIAFYVTIINNTSFVTGSFPLRPSPGYWEIIKSLQNWCSGQAWMGFNRIFETSLPEQWTSSTRHHHQVRTPFETSFQTPGINLWTPPGTLQRGEYYARHQVA